MGTLLRFAPSNHSNDLIFDFFLLQAKFWVLDTQGSTICICMTIEQLFFELLQVAIGTRICLSRTPCADEWGELYAMAKKQSLVGVCFAGVQRLQTQRQEPPEMLYLTWMGMAAKIQQRNELMDRYSSDVCKYFEEESVPCVILKGQGIATLYGNLKGLRQSGDIDVWLAGGRKKVYDLARKQFGMLSGVTFYHIHYPLYDDPEIEAHIWPSCMASPFKNICLKQFSSNT